MDGERGREDGGGRGSSGEGPQVEAGGGERLAEQQLMSDSDEIFRGSSGA